jgi:hypothetical protein
MYCHNQGLKTSKVSFSQAMDEGIAALRSLASAAVLVSSAGARTNDPVTLISFWYVGSRPRKANSSFSSLKHQGRLE